MKTIVTVTSHSNTYTFKFCVHASHTSAEQKIEESFYTKYYGTVFQGIHIELEILSPEVLEHALLKKDPTPLNVHCSEKDGKYYVLWIGPINTLRQANDILTAWCSGMVYTMEHERDYVYMLNEYHIAMDNFQAIGEICKEQYGIEVQGIEPHL